MSPTLRQVLIGAGSAVLAALVIGGFVRFTDWLDEIFRPPVPRGAVLAFDRDDLDEDSCPPGWQPFLEARARSIVGAGDPSKAPGKYGSGQDGQPLKTYTHRQHGGVEQVALTKEEMPGHNHPGSNSGPTPYRTATRTNEWTDYATAPKDQAMGQDTKTGLPLVIQSEGGSEPHNNLSPFIALYYCKKE